MYLFHCLSIENIHSSSGGGISCQKGIVDSIRGAEILQIYTQYLALTLFPDVSLKQV